jgi:hypothetical protein
MTGLASADRIVPAGEWTSLHDQIFQESFFLPPGGEDGKRTGLLFYNSTVEDNIYAPETGLVHFDRNSMMTGDVHLGDRSVCSVTGSLAGNIFADGPGTAANVTGEMDGTLTLTNGAFSTIWVGGKHPDVNTIRRDSFTIDWLMPSGDHLTMNIIQDGTTFVKLQVPEPSGLDLLCLGLIGFLRRR